MVEVFKTNICEPAQSRQVVDLLSNFFPGYKINFDLHDSDNILRVEADDIDIDQIMHRVKQSGFYCSVLK